MDAAGDPITGRLDAEGGVAAAGRGGVGAACDGSAGSGGCGSGAAAAAAAAAVVGAEESAAADRLDELNSRWRDGRVGWRRSRTGESGRRRRRRPSQWHVGRRAGGGGR